MLRSQHDSKAEQDANVIASQAAMRTRILRTCSRAQKMLVWLIGISEIFPHTGPNSRNHKADHNMASAFICSLAVVSVFSLHLALGLCALIAMDFHSRSAAAARGPEGVIFANQIDFHSSNQSAT